MSNTVRIKDLPDATLAATDRIPLDSASDSVMRKTTPTALFNLLIGSSTWAASASQAGILTNQAQTVGKSGAMTWQHTSVSGGLENLFTYKMTGDGTAKFELNNAAASNTVFIPWLRGTSNGGNHAAIFGGLASADSGSNGVVRIDARTVAGAAVAVRPLVELYNLNTSVLSVLPLNSGANACIQFPATGIGTPAFTTRSPGCKVNIWTSLSGSAVDYGFGIETSYMWAAVGNTSAGFKWYAGITNIMKLDGNGQRTYTAGAIRKSRIALTTPVTIAATDDIVFVKLTAPGPVAVNWPASPVAGQEHCVVDATGDANTNNITHTPAAGNFNGGATKVQNVAYSRLTGAYTGAEWIGA